jgi:sirohydrochlorin ferrochelatase
MVPHSSTESALLDDAAIGLIIVDHGSRRQESNELLLAVADAYRRHSSRPIVEPAHMELAEPSITTAFGRCVEQGAKLIVVFPYFLGPGRHWSQDIPRLAAEAARPFQAAGVRHLVTAPLGLHPLVMQVIDDRITHCLARATGTAGPCDSCASDSGCRLLPPLAPPCV